MMMTRPDLQELSTQRHQAFLGPPSRPSTWKLPEDRSEGRCSSASTTPCQRSVTAAKLLMLLTYSPWWGSGGWVVGWLGDGMRESLGKMIRRCSHQPTNDAPFLRASYERNTQAAGQNVVWFVSIPITSNQISITLSPNKDPKKKRHLHHDHSESLA